MLSDLPSRPVSAGFIYLVKESDCLRPPFPAEGLDERPAGDADRLQAETFGKPVDLSPEDGYRIGGLHRGVVAVAEPLGEVIGRIPDERLGVDDQPGSALGRQDVARMEVAVQEYAPRLACSEPAPARDGPSDQIRI